MKLFILFIAGVLWTGTALGADPEKSPGTAPSVTGDKVPPQFKFSASSVTVAPPPADVAASTTPFSVSPKKRLPHKRTKKK